MTLPQVLTYLGLWSLIGAVAFSLIVIYLFRSGRVYDARTEEGHLKEGMSLRGFVNILSFLILVVVFIAFTNYISLVAHGVELEFWPVFWLNLSLIVILVIYDTLVIDWWVIGIWRPSFLQLPNAMDKAQMKVHIKRTFFVAPVIALLIAVLSAVVMVLIW